MLGFSIQLVLTLASFLLSQFVSSALLPRTSADSISSQYGPTPDSTAFRISSSNNVKISQDAKALDTEVAAEPPPGLTFGVRFQEVLVKRLQAEALFVATMAYLAGLNQKAQVRGGPYSGTEYPDVLLSIGPAPGQHFEVEHLLWAIRWLHHEQLKQRVASWTQAVMDLHMNGVRIAFVGIIPVERLQTLPGSQNVSNAAIHINHSSVTTIPSFSKRVNAADPIGQNDTFSDRQLKVSVEYKSRVDLNELRLYLMYSTIILRLVYMQKFFPNKGLRLEDPILHISWSIQPYYPPRNETPDAHKIGYNQNRWRDRPTYLYLPAIRRSLWGNSGRFQIACNRIIRSSPVERSRNLKACQNKMSDWRMFEASMSCKGTRSQDT